MALCHTIVIDQKTGKFNASSPDELALIDAAKQLGAEYVDKDEDNIITLKFLDQTLQYKLLSILEFSSARKRMSVIIEDLSTKDLWLLTKGADSVIIPRLNPERI